MLTAKNEFLIETNGKRYLGTFFDASSHLYKRVCPSVRLSVRNAFVSNPQKRLFLTAEMDATRLVVMRGDEGEAVARMGDEGGGGDEG